MTTGCHGSSAPGNVCYIVSPVMGVTTVTLLCVTVLAVSFVTATEQLKVSYSIDEELQTNIVVGNVIVDTALGSKYERHVLAQLRFRLLPGKYNQYFSVNVSSGTLHTRETIDRETVCPRASVCRLLLDLAIVKPVELFQIIKISVTVVDKNDNAPQFPQQDVEFAVSENALPGMTFIIPNAEDLDSGIFSIQRYELSEQVANFDLQVTNGSAGVDLRLVLTGRLDRERQTSYGMTLVAYDGGMPARSGSLNIKITVLDANDNSPKFDRLLYEVTVAEDARPLTTIIKVHATDPDQGLNGQIVYSFTHRTQQSFGDTFAIGNATGEISIKKHLDYEAEKFYQLLVTGTDLGASSIPVHVKVMVYVEDVNDHPPVISINALSATGRTELYENAANGTFVAHVSVEDPDAHTNISCTVHSRYFTLLKLYPREYKIVTRSSFDREKRDKYTVTVECSDNGEPPLSSTQEVSVTILDRNDNAPLFAHSSYVVNVKENGTVGVALLVAQARDADSGSNADIIYTLAGEASNLLTVDPKTGVLKTNAVYDHELMVKFVCDVIATDQGSPSKSAITTITVNIVDVNDEAPIFSRAEYTFGTFENQPARTDIGSVLAMDADSAPYNEIVFSLQNTDGSTSAFQIDRHTGKISTTIVLDREKQSSHHMVVVATNVSPPRLSSSAQVIVYVADRNDNAPRIEFPNEENMTVQVSLYAPVGYTFCRILASDADLGENARLFYAITAGNKHSLFAINVHTGDISIGDDLGSTSTDVHKLLVVVRDNGADPKSAIATLTIIVNQSAVFDNFHFDMSSPVYAANSGPAIQLGYHERIMVILAVVTAVIVVILVTAIVLIKRRQTRFAKDAYQYTCQGDLYSTNSEVDRSTSYSDQEPHKSVNVSHLRDGDVTTMTEPVDTQKQDVLTCSDIVKAGYPVKTDHITLKVSIYISL